jgi:hypothetical protein
MPRFSSHRRDHHHERVGYLAMKRPRSKPTLQIKFMMTLAIIMVLAASIYYGPLVWLLFSPD